MRLVFIGAAVGAALTIPGLAGAGDPWLLLKSRPETPIALESGGRRDVLVSVDVANTTEHTVRVAKLRVTYLEGERPVGSVDPATSVFIEAGLLSDPRVPAGEHDTWGGLCLSGPTVATDRVRLDFDLTQRSGFKSVRSTQTFEIPLRHPVASPVIDSPVRGKWTITQGHACGSNHRLGPLGQEFAWDLAAVDAEGGPTFGRPVLAPADGRVVSVVDGMVDNEETRNYPRRSIVDALREPLWYFGNHVVVDIGHGAYVLLAHLKKGSIVVAPGDTVRAGARLGSVGNSGNARSAHLHVQVMSRADPTEPGVSGLPALLRDYVEITARGERREREAVVRRVESGDPPQGAVIVVPAPP